MIEGPINELQAVYEEFKRQCEADSEFYSDEKRRADERITGYNTVRDKTQVSTFEKYVASCFALSESSKMVNLSTQRVHDGILARFMVCTTWSILSIVDVLGKMEKSPVSQSDKETIENLKKQLAELQKSTSDMQPYVEMLKIGIEKKNKWMKDNV